MCQVAMYVSLEQLLHTLQDRMGKIDPVFRVSVVLIAISDHRGGDKEAGSCCISPNIFASSTPSS